MAPRKAATRAASSTAPAPAAPAKTTTRTTASKKATKPIKAPVEASKPAPKASKRKREDDEAPAAAVAASKKAKTTTTASKKATTTKPAAIKKTASGKTAPATAATKEPSTTPATTTKRKRAADDAPAPAAIKKAKKGPVINEAPTQKLDVYVCGENGSGELGLGTAKGAKDVKRARLNPLLAKDTVGVVQLDCGGMHVIALTHDNKILTWGVNDQGALGRDTAWEGGTRDMDAEDSDSEEEDDNGLNPLEASPYEVDWSQTTLPEGTKFTHVAAGDSCSFAVTDDGHVYGWGTFRDNNGIFGFTKKGDTVTRPVQIQKLVNVKSVSCAANTAYALTKTGQVLSWGAGESDQLGRRIVERVRESTLTPRPFGLPSGAKKGITSLHPGSDHCFAISKTGDVWAWGLNNFAMTGIPDKAGQDNATITNPRIVDALKGKEITDLAAGRHHSIACTKSGECLAWGRVDSHQLGIDKSKLDKLPESEIMRSEAGKLRVVLVPQKVDVDGDVAMVAAASDHSLTITKEGDAFSWGFNENYQTGQGGEDDDIAEPTKMIGRALEGKKLVGAGSGGQFSVLLGV